MDLCGDSLHHTHQTAAGARRYRSKSQRPCDLCRARKVLCNIPDPSRPCQLCDRTGRPCTFVAVSNKKQRTGSAHPGNVVYNCLPTDHPGLPVGEEADTQLADGESPGQGPNGLQPFDILIDKYDFDAGWSPAAADSTSGIPENGPVPYEGSNGVFDVLQDGELSHLWPMKSPVVPDGQDLARQKKSPNAGIRLGSPSHSDLASLDQRPDLTSIFIGYSNESDPFLLEHFPFNTSDEVDFLMVTYRRPSAVPVSPGNPPSHILQSPPHYVSQGRDAISKCMAMSDERDKLEQMVDTETGVALLRLYLKFVFQTLPIISRADVCRDEVQFIKSASPGLLAGLYTLAQPFAAWDERLCMNNAYSKPSSDALWQIAYTCLQKELHSPGLSTIQMFLLLLNHPSFDPVAVESPFAWSLASSMLAIAQSLGLHMEPVNWKLPADEIRLRRRLWWAVVVEHSWRAITQGRPSMLHEDDWNVSRLTPDDFTTDDTSIPVNSPSSDHFIQLCALTEITNSICRQFFSLRAVSQQQSLEDLMESAKGPRQRLLEWLESLPQSLCIRQDHDDRDTDELPASHGSLYVAYFTANILILRALLRPIISKEPRRDNIPSSVASVLHDSRSLLQNLFKFVRDVDVKQRSGFWPTYMRHCFCYPGLFCYMLCLQQAEPHMVASDRGLLVTWRSILRPRVQSWPLLRFAIVKVDALFWKKMDNLSSSSCDLSGLTVTS